MWVFREDARSGFDPPMKCYLMDPPWTVGGSNYSGVRRKEEGEDLHLVPANLSEQAAPVILDECK